MTESFEESSPVRAVHFDRGTHTLRVEFESGARYDFADVPEHVYDELARSAMPDAYFRANVCDEFIGTPADEFDLAEMAHERREDALLGAPLAESLPAKAHLSRHESLKGDGQNARASHHTWVVDVIDDDAAAIEVDGRRITPIPRWILPADARDGDVLRVTHSRSGTRSRLSIEVDHDATREAFERSAEQVRDAPSGGVGDVDLNA
jgi:hypothetical protein